MSLGIWILREQARPLAEQLTREVGGTIETAPSGENQQVFRERFDSRSQWVIIGASGVATRFVSGLLSSKKTDPAVVVLDEAARFAMPLVGGHEGGANALAYDVAKATGATPVVTTATEALKSLVVGVGCRKGVTSQQIDEAVLSALPEGRSVSDIREVVTVDLKAREAGLIAWAAGQGLPMRVVDSQQIAARPWVSEASDWVKANIGLPGVCEPAALIASPRGRLVVPKTSFDGVSVAVVEENPGSPRNFPEPSGKGKLTMVSLGPGNRDLIPPRARAAIAAASDVVGYGLYLDLVEPWLSGKTEHRMPLTQERARAEKSIELAKQGKDVALLSSGDIGIYAMATLVFELLEHEDFVETEVIPGITAATSCAALLGAPLAHDFATLSLSDLLCPWEWIERRATAIAESDLAVALYNVQSKARPDGVKRILEIMRQHKGPNTVCGVVRNAWREEQDVQVCTLEELEQMEFDMLTTVIVGNRFTRMSPAGMFSPRGYLDWQESSTEGDFPDGAIWVFSGTHDGNEIANAVHESGVPVIVSVATDYGVEVAQRSLTNGVLVINGAQGGARRRQMLKGANAIVDATHPFAQKISKDLVAIAAEYSLPYIRYERPSKDHDNAASEVVPDFETALEKAVALGRRIFLATGGKELGVWKKSQHRREADWYVRMAPDAASLKTALEAGIPRSHLCFMQGPFSAAFNKAQWKNWEIDCLVTRESGKGSGLEEKLEAAQAMGIPIVLIQRPPIESTHLVRDVAGVLGQLENLR